MRIPLLCLLYFTLTSCAYYGDIHGHSRRLNAARLSVPHTYTPSSNDQACGNWWDRFHDAQLNQLIHIALLDSPNLQIAASRVRRAQSLAAESASLLWPTIDLSGYVQRQRFSTFGLAPPPFNGKTFNIGTVALNFNYEFDFWGKYRQTLMASISETCAAQAELAEARLVISAAVASTYFQLRGNLSQAQLAKTQWLLGEQILEIATTRAHHGINSDIPVKEIEANVQANKLLFERYQRAATLSRHQLSELLGKNPFVTKIMVKPFAFQSQQVTLPASLPANLLGQRPDIAAARMRAQAAASRVLVAKARFFPDINLNALFSYQSVGLEHLFNPQSQNNAITGAFDLPIFDAGARRANLGAKYAEYDLAVNEYNQTILNALREVADQATNLNTLNAQLKAQNLAVQATRQHYKLFRSRYTHGITDYLQVLNSKQLWVQQQTEQVELQTRHLQATVAMLKALGGKAEPHVKLAKG